MASVSFGSEQGVIPGFTAAEEQDLRREDSEAFGNVTGILLFVVSAGLLLGLLSVLTIVFAGLQ